MMVGKRCVDYQGFIKRLKQMGIVRRVWDGHCYLLLLHTQTGATTLLLTQNTAFLRIQEKTLTYTGFCWELRATGFNNELMM